MRTLQRALDDGMMVCSQCGAVVGMTYGPAERMRTKPVTPRASPAAPTRSRAPHAAPPSAFSSA